MWYILYNTGRFPPLCVTNFASNIYSPISSEMMDKSKSFIKLNPPKAGILIQNTISKYSKTKNQTQKTPPKVPKKSKTYIRRPQIKKFYKTDPQKAGILIQNTISKFSKTKNQTQKRPPKVPKNQKHI